MKKLYLLSVLLLSAAMPLIINAQVPGITWQHCYGGTDNEAVKDVNSESFVTGTVPSKGFAQARGGGYFIAGQSNSSNWDIPRSNKSTRGVGTLAIVKVDELGTVIWSKTAGGAGSDNAYDQFGNVQETVDRGCIVIGYTLSSDGEAQGNQGQMI